MTTPAPLILCRQEASREEQKGSCCRPRRAHQEGVLPCEQGACHVLLLGFKGCFQGQPLLPGAAPAPPASLAGMLSLAWSITGRGWWRSMLLGEGVWEGDPS